MCHCIETLHAIIITNFRNFRYQSEDRSLVTKYILKPFWSKFVYIFPMWMAPNVVTLSGFGFIILNIFTVLYYDPTLSKESPRWTYFTYALGLFLYQTFDACDGTHARRTGQSGPLGELFDHCIDSLNTTLSMLVFCSAARTGMGYMTILAQFALLCNFYLSTWEEYHTHKLFLSEFSGPVEGILIIIGAFIITGIYGSEKIWHTLLFEFSWGSENLRVETIHALFGFSGIAVFFNILSARKNVVDYYTQNHSRKEESERQIILATRGLVPYFSYYASIALVVLIEPQIISLPFILTIGLTMAFTVGRIIICHLTKQSYPMFNPPMLIPTVQLLLRFFFVNVLSYKRQEVIPALNWFGFGLSFGIHSMFITEVIYEFTTYLDIYALSIKHPKTA